jgi:hypothetical protein
VSEKKDGVQAYYFGRWLVGYIRTNAQYRSCNVHFGQGIISCSPENVSNESQKVVYRGEPANQITIDGLVTNADGEIVLLVKLETGGLGERQIREIVKTISNCNRYEVCRPSTGQYYYPIPSTRYIIAGAQSGPFGAAKVPITNEIMVEFGLRTDPLSERLKNITIVIAKNGCVLGKLKRAIAKLMPRYSNPRDINSFQTLAPPMV